jgi:serine/threonine-protein kinase
MVGEGLSEVYEVLDLEIDAIIALKLFASSADSRDILERSRRELMLARELTHENIVRVYDIGQHEGRRFITMEMLDGVDLRELMDDRWPSQTESIRYLVQACRGLHAAHLRGVVHRDVKPENFFVVSGGQVKVMDFGIAKKATDTDEVPQEGVTAGTPAYMSPEQARDYGGVTPASDVYSLGVVAYELFTGTLPFDSEDVRQLMMMHLRDLPPPPTWVEPEIPSELEDVVLEALAKKPEDRVKSCRAMAERLESALRRLDDD